MTINIRKMRKEKEYTQTEIASILFISQRTYSAYETGRINISYQMLSTLADFYHTSIDYLVGKTDVQEPYPPAKCKKRTSIRRNAMITYRQRDASCLKEIEQIPMLVPVEAILRPKKIDNGLGGILLEEAPVKKHVKDLGQYEWIGELPDRFDLANWAFFVAYDKAKAVGSAIVASRTKGVDMLEGREDLSVLWDLRVDSRYARSGIGSRLFDMAAEWSRQHGLRQMKIECQNNNIPACRFYHKKGAVLCALNEYAYYAEPALREEVQFIWYLDL